MKVSDIFRHKSVLCSKVTLFKTFFCNTLYIYSIEIQPSCNFGLNFRRHADVGPTPHPPDKKNVGPTARADDDGGMLSGSKML